MTISFGTWCFWYWASSWLLFSGWAPVKAVKSEWLHCHQTSLWTCHHRRRFLLDLWTVKHSPSSNVTSLAELWNCARDKSRLRDSKTHLKTVCFLWLSIVLHKVCLMFRYPAAPQIHLEETKRHIVLFHCTRCLTWCKYTVDLESMCRMRLDLFKLSWRREEPGPPPRSF